MLLALQTWDSGRPCVTTPTPKPEPVPHRGLLIQQPGRPWTVEQGSEDEGAGQSIPGRGSGKGRAWAAVLEATRAARPTGSQAGGIPRGGVSPGLTGSRGVAAGCDGAAGSDPSPFSVPRPQQHGDWAESRPKRPETGLQPAAADTRARCGPGWPRGPRALVLPGSRGAAGLLPGLRCRGAGLRHPRGPGGESEARPSLTPVRGSHPGPRGSPALSLSLT